MTKTWREEAMALAAEIRAEERDNRTLVRQVDDVVDACSRSNRRIFELKQRLGRLLGQGEEDRKILEESLARTRVKLERAQAKHLEAMQKVEEHKRRVSLLVGHFLEEHVDESPVR